MLAEWQGIQQSIWALEAEGRHIQESRRQVLSRLGKLQSYRCELRLAIRQLRQSSNASQVGWSKSCGSSEPLGLEKVASPESAEAWSALWQHLAQSPEAISLLAKAAGPPSHGLLALFAAALAEEPPVASLHGYAKMAGGDLGQSNGATALEKVISAELKTCLERQAPGTKLEASVLLGSGSFLGELCLVLTAQEPACMAWGQGVLHREARVREALRQLVHTASGTADPVDHESQESRAASPSGADANRKLQNAVSAVVTSFCEHASVAPFALCRLSAILRRQFASYCASYAGGEEIQDAVLGELILRRWLLPSLGPGLPARQHAQAAVALLTKSLFQIASGTLDMASRKTSEDASLGGIDASSNSERSGDELESAFLQQEVMRLKTGLFDVLAARGEASALQAEVEVTHNTAWPRCLVCTAGEIAALGHVLAGVDGKMSPAVISVATSIGLNEEVLKALRTVPTGHYGTAVIYWMSEHAAHDPAGDRNEMQSTFASTLATSPSASNTLNKSQDAVQDRMRVRWLALLWRCLADSQALDGPAEGTLTTALEALARSYGPAPSGGLSGQQLRLEALLSWLRPHDDPRLALLLTPTSSEPTGVDFLLGCFRDSLEARQMRLTQERRTLIQLQVAEPLLEQLCMDTLRMLKDCARYKTQLLCNSRLQALWQHAGKRRSLSRSDSAPAVNAVPDAPRDRTSDDTSEVLELCIVSVSANGNQLTRTDSRRSSCPPTRSTSGKWLSSLFGNSAEQSRESSQNTGYPLKGLELMQASIQIFEVPQCPIHKVLLAGASMGLEAQSLEHNVKHETVKGLHQAVRALQQLPLDSELLSPGPLGVGTAVQTILEQIVSRLFAHCQRFDPAVSRPEHAESCDFGPDSAKRGESSKRCLVNSWPRPAEVVCTDEQHVRDNAVQFLFSHLHSHIFPSKPTEADLRLSRQIAQLSWLEPRHLDISPVFEEMSQTSRAISLLRGLRSSRSPGEMLDALAMAFRGLTESACIFAQAGIAESSDDALGADVSLPLFILVIIRANPPMLESVLTYVERFTPKAQLLTAEGYAHVQARAAVSFAENITATDLVGLRPGEWEDFVGVEAARHPI